jgi:hypothetical protein
MKKEIGWVEKTPEGRVEISVKLFGGKVYWSRRLQGEDHWDDSMVPNDDQWEELLRLYRNRAQRGFGTQAELASVEKRAFGEVRGKPRQAQPAPSKKPGNAA